MAAIDALAFEHDPAPFVRALNGRNRLELSVTGARCAGCIKTIESGVLALPGVAVARMNLSTGKLAVEWAGAALAARDIVSTLADKGFPAKAFDPQGVRNAEDAQAGFLLKCLAVAGFAAGNIMLFSVSIWAGGDMSAETRTLFHWLSALIAIPAAAYAGRPFFRSALAALASGRANMDVPISLGVTLALGISIAETIEGREHAFFDAAVTLLFFLLIGRTLDYRLRARARAAANDLLSLQSASATRIAANGRVESIAARDVQAGDRILVAQGERLIADGVLETAEGEFDLSLLTGESMPQAISARAAIKAGALNTGKPAIVAATAAVADSYVADLARLLESAEQNRARYVRVADQAARLYVPIVHGLALAAFVSGVALGLSWHDALMRAVSLLIITCPCALGLAVPAVQIVAAGRLFKRGLIVKSGDALERLAGVTRAIFDKTGTLSFGRPELLNPEAIEPGILEQAAQLARASRHPLARALQRAAGTGPVCAGVEEVAGQGLIARVGGRVWRLGRASFAGSGQAPEGGGSELWFAKEGEAPKVFRFADRLRVDAAEALAKLAALGIKAEILSGDRTDAVAQAAAQTGLTQWRAGTLPEEKLAHVRRLRAGGTPVLVLGDGLNDAAALAEADASISPGDGSDAAQSAADFVLTGPRLMPVVEAIVVARAARARVRENLAFSVLYNLCAVPLAFAGMVTPLIAAIAMSGSSLIVTLNALRLARDTGKD